MCFAFWAGFCSRRQRSAGNASCRVITLPSYILCFPTLTAMGLTEHANYSVIFGSVLHMVNLAILYFTGHMNSHTGCAVSVAEALILGYRIFVVWRHRSIFQREETP